MGIVINPRGAGGSGKTGLVRRLMAGFGPAEPIPQPGRARPIGYRLPHPAGGRPLAVLGAYGPTCGGCDTIPLRDGGLEEAFRRAAALAAAGHDVVLEGRALSREHAGTAALARAHPVLVLQLATPAEACARALAARHRAPRAALPRLEEHAAREQAEIASSCAQLRATGVAVERLDVAAALARARGLLGLDHAPAPQTGVPATATTQA